MPLRSSPENTDEDAAEAALDITRRTRRALYHSNKILRRSTYVFQALEPFREERVKPSRARLLLLARTAWNRKWQEPAGMRDAITLYDRAGAIEELNRIGEFLGADLAHWSIDAFFAAGNRTRVHEVGEDMLQHGDAEGLRAFNLLGETPSVDLIRAFAYATLKNLWDVIPMLEAVRSSGITLPRDLLLRTARRYRKIEADTDANLLLGAANDPRVAVDPETPEPVRPKRKP